MTLTREQEADFVDQLSKAMAREAELLVQRHAIGEIVSRLVAAHPDDRDAIIAELASAVASGQ